ncbi:MULTISPECIES: NADPH-dependent F420 reductase [unclassified Streptomyces]|uniref:NADPH-dependent F420 reductase n=1 Tax=unclassified Streptomyces TaxID=2593676 RepID=UPI00093E8A50|nr:NAD(P)-binding domain-containing protein [Streptomyces sp. CB01883]OKJ81059.1 oxidoreductase [Streptomyces sp. CB01883]
MPLTLGLTGSGAIRTALARLAVAAGLDVVLGNSRGPETLSELVDTLGSHARAATPAEAAQAGDLVVVTVPMTALDRLPADALTGKIVLDTGNYHPRRDGQMAELDIDEITSSGLLQRHLPGSSVVKAFNSIGSGQLFALARPAGSPDRSALPIAGDSAEAKQETGHLLDLLGYDAVDIGMLADSWRSEPNNPVYVEPYRGVAPEGLEPKEWWVWSLEDPGTPVGAAQVRELVASAERGPSRAGLLPAGPTL